MSGNNAFGFITVQDDWSASYKAPSAKPPTNPVAISVEDKKGGLLVANVEVMGGDYLVTIDFSTTVGSITCTLAASATASDHTSFTVKRLPDGTLSIADIVNTKTVFSPPTLEFFTVVVDSDPEWMTLTQGTAAAAGKDILVQLNYTRTIGGCTLIGEGTPVSAPPSTSEQMLDFIIEDARFGPDGTAPVNDVTGQHTIEAKEL